MKKIWRCRSNLGDILKTKLPKYDNVEMQERINREIHDATDREIMRCKLIDNLTFSAISDKLDLPFSTVRDHFYKNRKILFS